ncbi:MAG: N-6 DNA methylase [Acholeplasmatales bacterium]|jgi:site-specific DNA-methyltransferase (adenine-specific)|nr:N-6 DNA methylase [Acholeplasmatales bacterium]MBQ4357014.1 N-6 DNA methylase [Acholeplasmatales bacterium]
MQEVKMDNLELFYDVLDESNNFLYEIFHKPYFELLEMTVRNILAGEVVCDIDDLDKEEELEEIYAKIKDVDFSAEDVRKAMQSIVLRGFKEMRIPNGNTTPDTLGILAAYLITKIHKEKELSILDPLCGTGNLLFTIANYLDKKTKLFAIDDNEWMTKITALTADLLDYPVEVYYQNTMSLQLSNIDSIVFDMPHSEYTDGKYFPYEAILHFVNELKEDGSMIAIVENDFFDYDSNQEFKKKLLESMSILGIIELPDSMFNQARPKLILVLQKRQLKDAKCFMVKLPSFNDVEDFNNALRDIEAWFLKNNYNKKGK